MILFLAGVVGFVGALVAHDLAAQALHEQPLRPLVGSCPGCGARRGWFGQICPRCQRRVGREWLLVLIATVVAVGFANTVGAAWALLPFLGFLVLSLALGITDLDALRIVDRLNLRGTGLLIVALGLAAVADGTLGEFGRALLGAGVYFVGTNVMFLAVRGRGFGYGDVKLSAQLGLFSVFVSWGTLGWSVFITALLGGVVSLTFLAVAVVSSARARRSADGGAGGSMRDFMKTELPYGPAMIVGAWVAIGLAGLGAFPLPV